MLEEAARKFIDKVDNGRARNKETYAELKVAMGTDESVPVEAVVIKKIVIELNRIGNEYLEKYGCESCWADLHKCTCKHDKARMKTFLDMVVTIGKQSNFAL